jgi:hypothetical protein
MDQEGLEGAGGNRPPTWPWGQDTFGTRESEGMPAQRNQRSTRPAATARAGSTTARRGDDGNGNGRRNNRAANWPVELSIGTR